MKFWPSDTFEIETTMSLDAILAALGSKFEPKKFFRFTSNHAPFDGQATRGVLALFLCYITVAIAYGVVMGGFWIEANEQKPMLIEMFTGIGTSEQPH
jgi:hypothetical protein